MGAKGIIIAIAIVLAPVVLVAGYGMYVLSIMGATAAASSSSGCNPAMAAAATAAATSTSTPAPIGPGCAAAGMAVPPLGPGYSITSGFGYRGDVGLDGVSDWHYGIDLQNPTRKCGDPVYSVLPGEVILSSKLYLTIKHPDGFVISYLHMYESQRLVSVGDQVVAGQQIGVTGKVPPATGCHLDLRIAAGYTENAAVLALLEEGNGLWIDPEKFMALYGVTLCDPALSCTRP